LTVRILLTRPETDAQRTAATLRALGHDVILAPLLRIDVSSDAELGTGPWAGILVTSANAARAIAFHTRYYELRAIPVFAVGERSAQTMRVAGFSDVTSADGNVAELAKTAAQRVNPGEQLLYLAGTERSGDLAAALPGLTVRTAVIYSAVAAETLPRAAAEALEAGVDAVLHFSRRSADIYVTTARAAGLAAAALGQPIHCCLSVQVAEPLTEAAAANIRIAAQPNESALLELLKAA
jgi:uroporphyrinogen-III synthase